MIDAAQSYFNEEEVGSNSSVPRSELFITTKVWIENYVYEQPCAATNESIRNIQVWIDEASTMIKTNQI